MALRQLIIAGKLTALRARLGEIETRKTAVAERRSAWKIREAQAVEAFGEITEETSAEDRAAFDAEADAIETENQSITEEENAVQTDEDTVNGEIAQLEAELEEINKRSAGSGKSSVPKDEKRGTNMSITPERNRREAIRALLSESEEVRTFIGKFRENRGVTNAEYTIPTVMLPMLRQAADGNSKLLKHISQTTVNGDAQINLLGAPPEAVWTESTGKFNEESLSISQITVSAYKLAGYIAIPNCYLEDSDENLTAVIVDALGQSLGIAEDKAILYGTGVNMPVGIVTRLAATSTPAWWGSKQGTFTDLHSSHIGALTDATLTGAELFKEMVAVLGKAKEVYSNSNPGKFWAMNEATWLTLQTALLDINASGSVVTGASRTMPVIGGAVELLSFVPDGAIVGGYGSQYKLVRRDGVKLAKSEHVKFLDDQMTIAAKVREDGKPICGEGFASFTLSATAADTEVDFEEDTANADESGT